MFKNSLIAGKHLISDFSNIKNTTLLNDCEKLKDMCRQLCLINDFTIIGELSHIFTPQGCSFIFLLTESHLSVHTYPERNHISFDLYTCREYDSDKEYQKIIELLKKELQSEDHSLIVNRQF